MESIVLIDYRCTLGDTFFTNVGNYEELPNEVSVPSSLTRAVVSFTL